MCRYHFSPLTTSSLWDSIYHFVRSSENSLSQQFRISRIQHLEFIGCRTDSHRGLILHIRFPFTSEYVPKLLDLQRSSNLPRHIVQQLIIGCQLTCQFNYHISEYLGTDITVQSFHQFRTTKSPIHP